MKKIFLFLLLLSPVIASAQMFPPTDSTKIIFLQGSGLTATTPGSFTGLTSITVDTTSTTLWQIGNTIKATFSMDSIPSYGIMTDTLHPYPANANDFFLLKEIGGVNFSINFWHTYQTDSLHAGGIVEYSTDSGTSWMNVADCEFIQLANFYTSSDTIASGQAAFTGNSYGEQMSSIYILNCVGVKSTNTSCMDFVLDGPYIPFYFRFRFISDSTIDSLAGWKIDSIQIVGHECPGAVPVLNKESIIILSPNPAYDMLTITCTNTINNITIANLMGQTVYSNEFNTKDVQINIADLPKGIYLVKVNDSEVRKLVKE